MEQNSLSYREVIPNINSNDDWKEININAGGTHSTLQDFKVPEKAGGYSYQNSTTNQCRNRYIYWRCNLEVLELTETSLDFNLYDNNLRLVFTDSPVLSVEIVETQNHVVLLVATVSSLHRILFPHPDTLLDNSAKANASSGAGFESQSFSIFKDLNASTLRNPSNFYALDQHHSVSNTMPKAATCYLHPSKNVVYFAVAYPTALMLYVMNCDSGQTVGHQLKENYLMPRLFTNIKGALTGKSDFPDAELASSSVFLCHNGNIYLLALYPNDDLRVWCTKTFSCLNTLSCKRMNMGDIIKGPRNNILRKINDNEVCAFLWHSNVSEFVCINMDSEGNNISLLRHKVIACPRMDLIDFDVTEERIWALWSNENGEYSVSSYPLRSDMGVKWISVALEPPPDRYSISVEQGMDPREAYCSYIFHPGKFDHATIAKALFMFRKTNVRVDSKSMNLSLLKEHVCMAIEEELQNELKAYDMNDEDYLELSTKHWERFYTHCEQYHEKSSKPAGLFVLKSFDAICLIRKQWSSLLRPCEILEHLMLAGNDVDVNVVVPKQFPGNERIGEGLIHLIGILAQIEKWLPDDVKMEIDKQLYQLESPQTLIANLSTEILSGDPDKEILPRNFIVYFRQSLQSINDLREPIMLLLDTLRMDNGNPEAMQTHISVAQSSRLLLSIGSLFGSNLGLSLLSETVRQTSMIRFAACRNLLIFLRLLVDSFVLSPVINDAVLKQFIPEISTFLQAYYVIVWIAEKPINLAQTSNNDSSRQRLCRFQLLSNSDRFCPFNSQIQIVPLLHMFLRSKGLNVAMVLCSDHLKSLTNNSWQSTLLPLNTIISQLIWPISSNFIFGEWLFSTCQHAVIEDYVRLLNSWCNWNMASRSFILAVTLLDCGEIAKSHDVFMTCSEKTFQENFLREKILFNSPEAEYFKRLQRDELNEEDLTIAENKAVAQYLLKMIQLFEHYNALDHVVELAKEAAGLLEEGDPQLPMFQSIVFINELQMEHYDEAYHSMIYNADVSRRKDCLRQFIITLFQKNQIHLLLKFPYAQMKEEFRNIVESRARSLAIENNDIYNFLYSYYINNDNFRKASAIMYEQALRLQYESNSLDALEERFHSLLICKNALHLCDEHYQWIAKPALDEDYNDTVMENGDEDETAQDILKKEVEVVEIKDIQRELLQTEALVNLSKIRKDIQSYLKAGPQELAFILASCGLYTPALKLATGCGISLFPIFESLTAACLRATEDNPNDTSEWLQENNLASLPQRLKSSDTAWSLLQYLVEEHEEENSTAVRKSVVNKILSMNAFVPQWLYNSYKRDNCPELLKLFVNHSRLLEAADLAEELMNAMLGAGSEYFSFKHSMAVTNPFMCLPCNTIETLLHGLKINSEEDIDYKKALANLEDLLDKYIATALRTANDKVSMLFQKT